MAYGQRSRATERLRLTSGVETEVALFLRSYFSPIYFLSFVSSMRTKVGTFSFDLLLRRGIVADLFLTLLGSFWMSKESSSITQNAVVLNMNKEAYCQDPLNHSHDTFLALVAHLSVRCCRGWKGTHRNKHLAFFQIINTHHSPLGEVVCSWHLSCQNCFGDFAVNNDLCFVL